jgi:hypothetical protein
MINTKKVSNPIANMKKSCGQNILPKNMNLRSNTLIRKTGSFPIFKKGNVKNKIR